MKTIYLIINLFALSSLFAQGPYAPPVGQAGCTAIYKDSTILVSWATNTIIERGWQDISDTSLGKVTAGNDTSATGKSGVNGVVSLGDGGFAILTFDGKIYDGVGADFTVFENSFDGLFLELAFVEVSSDGINFFRFDAVSLTDTAVQIGTFGNLDATNLNNFAGKYIALYGTPFDLNELAGTPGLDINNVTHIKIIDVVGSITEPFYTFDSQNNVVNEPWSTPFPVGGFDLDAVGVINFVPTSIKDLSTAITINSYPNPTQHSIHFDAITPTNYSYQLVNLNGEVVLNGILTNELDISHLKAGVYFIKIQSDDNAIVKKIIKQ